tara:strand:- start:71 stop:271 length:201 start_codon:yes stop_codon:yes gene_type:complete
LQLSLRLIGLWERGESVAEVAEMVGWKVEGGTATAAAEMARARLMEEVVTERLKGVVNMVSAVCWV